MSLGGRAIESSPGDADLMRDAALHSGGSVAASFGGSFAASLGGSLTASFGFIPVVVSFAGASLLGQALVLQFVMFISCIFRYDYWDATRPRHFPTLFTVIFVYSILGR